MIIGKAVIEWFTHLGSRTQINVCERNLEWKVSMCESSWVVRFKQWQSIRKTVTKGEKLSGGMVM